ncbi:hypothetical protein BDQ17DRAFT_1537727 [Cyathus striatus]|nr:hypothetical protein BDQ17DRAFT_1537727 [Cyathus striatus]
MAEGLPTPKLSDTESLSSYFEQSAAAVQSYTGNAIALLAILSFVITAIIGVLIATVTVLVLLLFFLTAALIVIFLFSVFLTLAAIAVLVFLRFILLISRLGLTGGLLILYDEVKSKFLATPTIEHTKREE